MTKASALMLASAAIVGALGALHLLFTFHGPKLLPRDPTLIEHMQAVPMVITRETTVWKAWIGFNASHSLCALLFALVYGYLALRQPALLFGSGFLLAVGLGLLTVLLGLCWRYWFSAPLTGLALAWVCYLAALGLRAAE